MGKSSGGLFIRKRLTSQTRQKLEAGAAVSVVAAFHLLLSKFSSQLMVPSGSCLATFKRLWNSWRTVGLKYNLSSALRSLVLRVISSP